MVVRRHYAQRSICNTKTKDMKLHAAICIVSLLAARAFAEVTILDTRVNPSNGHTYYLLSPSTWADAQAFATTNLGGNLATIRSLEENQWAFDTFASFGGVDRALWIGLTDRDVEGTFRWVSGEPVGFTRWAEAEPNSGFGAFEEDYAVISPNNSGEPTLLPSLWNDANGEQSASGLVEVISPCSPVASIRVSQIEVCWLSCTNRMYQVQYRSELTTNAWVNFGAPLTGADTTNCVTDAISSPRRFYRVVLLP